MRKIAVLLGLLLAGTIVFTGCGRRIDGPRFWWDDKNQERLPEGYVLPDDPAAPSEIDVDSDRRSMPSGEDLSDEDLSEYRTDLDRREERRKSDASLVDF